MYAQRSGAGTLPSVNATGPTTIPAFLHFDVEPDGFQVPRDGRDAWSGYGAFHEFSRSLRDALARASGATATFNWYFRTDPQIAQMFGRADVAVTGFPDRVAALCAAGDGFGVHVHPLRWSADRGVWVHDIGDRRWLRDCTSSALDAFERSIGAPARLFRSGAGFLHDEIVDVLDERGVVLELGLEPVSGVGRPDTVASGVDASPIVGEYVECSAAPRTPYRPDPQDFRRRGGANARRITIVPATTAPRRLPPSGWGLRLRRLLGRPPRSHSTRVLFPSGDWPSDRSFWDLAAHQLSVMERPYLSIGVRTDARDSAVAATVKRRLWALARHPLARRLRFVNPLDAVDQITPPLVAPPRLVAS